MRYENQNATIAIRYSVTGTLVVLRRISCYVNCHVACSRLALMWSSVVGNINHFRAMCCPVNLYCDLDVSCIVAFS